MKASTHELWAFIFTFIAIVSLIYLLYSTSLFAFILSLIASVWSAEHRIIAELKRGKEIAHD